MSDTPRGCVRPYEGCCIEGACESCFCCCAGYCILGKDDMTDISEENQEIYDEMREAFLKENPNVDSS